MTAKNTTITMGTNSIDQLNKASTDLPEAVRENENEQEEEDLYYFYDDDLNFEKLKWRDMPGSEHEDLLHYLLDVLRWHYRLEKCAVYGELNFYETSLWKEEPLYPDLAILKGQAYTRRLSYRIGTDGPPPQVVIELMSEKTRRKDLEIKPGRYAHWGTREYFSYDPRPRLRKSTKARLAGWRLLPGRERYEEITADRDGRMWSEELEAWLVADEGYLRLFSGSGEQWPTEGEAERLASRRERETARAKIARLTARLRQLGVNPDDEA